MEYPTRRIQRRESDAQAADQGHTSIPKTGATLQLRGKSLADQQVMLTPGANGYSDQQTASAPVQRKGGDDNGDIHAAAARGTGGGRGSMPHLDRIQASFGNHDVSTIQAYSGGAAAEATRSMGAEAYATGNKVAFGGAPSLHTAAHESAHIVQQRRGASLSGGVGKSGDRYEQHADSVADAVVQGKSAQGLLDRMTGGGGGGAAASVQNKDAVQLKDDDGAWNKQYTDTSVTFLELIRQNLLAAEAWKNTAEVVDPPSAWKSALKVVGGVVLSAALGGVGAVLAAKFIKEGAKLATKFAINAAINGGKKAAEKGVAAAFSSASGAGSKAPIVTFCEQQKIGMSQASKDAREAFSARAGDSTHQNISVDEMKEIAKNNDSMFTRATTIQNKEMLIGWMNTLGGYNGLKNANKEDTSHKGILGLVISGQDDNAKKIYQANTEGLNKGLRAQISGTKLSEWVTGKGRKRGLNIVIRTGPAGQKPDSFQVSAATKKRMKAAGVWSGSTNAINERGTTDKSDAIYFAFGIDSRTSTSYTDTDMAWHPDYACQADAGRWFLNNVKTQHALLKELGSKTIPTVTS
ncbi:MAG: hypothetical protein ACI9WU_002764 [Myxococcota bacterium]|jgi:hypothetical protein